MICLTGINAMFLHTLKLRLPVTAVDRRIRVNLPTT
jgi:hypothetical protein